MKQTINISDFLRTGEFGRVQVNDSLKIVIDKLGEPDGNINIGKRLKGIHYGRYEFVFDEDGLKSIQNDSFNTKYLELMEFENDKIIINPEFLNAKRAKNLKEIKKALQDSNIQFSIFDYYERKAIKTVGNVIIDFNDEKWSDRENTLVKIKNKEDFKLVGFRYHPKDK